MVETTKATATVTPAEEGRSRAHPEPRRSRAEIEAIIASVSASAEKGMATTREKLLLSVMKQLLWEVALRQSLIDVTHAGAAARSAVAAAGGDYALVIVQHAATDPQAAVVMPSPSPSPAVAPAADSQAQASAADDGVSLRRVVELADALLDELGGHFGSAGCNDHTLDDTPENRLMVRAKEFLHEGRPPIAVGGTFGVYDFDVLHYVRRRLAEAFGIKRKGG